MNTHTEQCSNLAITYVRQPQYAKWGFNILLASAAALGFAGAAEQIASKGPEFGIMAVELSDRFEAASGTADGPAVSVQDRIAAYEAAIADFHSDRDSDWLVGGILLATAVAGAAGRAIARSQENSITQLPNATT